MADGAGRIETGFPWLVRTLLAVAAVAALTCGGGGTEGAARAATSEPDPVVVARAFNAAWNAHDVEGVVAFFAPGATIRQPRALVVASTSDEAADDRAVEDTYGAGGRPLPAADARAWSGDGVLWATGSPRVRAWLPWFFAGGHRVEASGYRAEGDTVTWRYRAFADPYQRVAGVEPAEGTAQLVVHAGRVTSFTFDTDEAVVVRRRRQIEAGLRARLAPDQASAQPPGAPRVPGTAAAGAVAPAAPGAPESGLSLALVGAAVLAGLVVTGRRRRRSSV